ncbi:MAG: isoprenylcysteine carboxylmethyltransferase family protein [Bdellovibrionota bacterium]
MITPSADAARVRFPPPLLYLLTVLTGVLLHAFVLPLPLAAGGTLRVFLAGGMGLAAVLLMWGAFGRFRETGQNPKPWTPSPELITNGIYRYTRNPMYVSLALLQGAIGAALANLWIVALVPVSLIAVYFVAVRHEEAYLEEKFGEPYRQYKKSVRRWL